MTPLRGCLLLLALGLVSCDDTNSRPDPDELPKPDATDVEANDDGRDDTELGDTQPDGGEADELELSADGEGDSGPDEDVTLPDSERVAALLEAAVDGILWTSESDYPFVVFVVPGGATPPVDAANVKDKLAAVYEQRADTMPLVERTVEQLSVDEVLLPRIEEQEWWGDEERATAAKLEQLRVLLTTELEAPTAFRIGPFNEWSGLAGDIDVVLLGTSDDGALVGVMTVSIET